jgi:hypothetical protein
MVIAIDGPAGAGKSTVARAIAERLGFTYLDTGAMYRCVALAVRERDGDAAAVAEALRIELGERVLLDGRDVTEAIRAPAVSDAASESPDPASARPGAQAAGVLGGRLGRGGPRHRHGVARRRRSRFPHRLPEARAPPRRELAPTSQPALRAERRPRRARRARAAAARRATVPSTRPARPRRVVEQSSCPWSRRESAA